MSGHGGRVCIQFDGVEDTHDHLVLVSEASGGASLGEIGVVVNLGDV